MYQQDTSGNMSVFTGELNYSEDLIQIFVSNNLQVVVTNVVFVNCIMTCRVSELCCDLFQ
jgi:hypothetical protein